MRLVFRLFSVAVLLVALYMHRGILRTAPIFNRSTQKPILLQTRAVSPRRHKHTNETKQMRVVPVPVRSDNYAYLLIDEATNKAAAIDPFDPKKVKEAAEAEGVTLGEQVITTHHHQDHSGGNAEFAKMFPGVTIYGGSNQCQGMTKQVKDGDTFKVGQNIQVRAYATPCHTQDSISFFVEDKSKSQRGVFTGDTLFISGCGRFFEGQPSEMHTALNKTLASLPDDTIVYPGHEYTKSNVAFSKSVDPENTAIKDLASFCEQNEVTTGKFTIANEKAHNVFMRLGSEAVKQKTGTDDPVQAMGILRDLKNNFRS